MKILVIPTSYPNVYSPNSAPFFRDQALALKAVGNEVAVLAVTMISLKKIFNKKNELFRLNYFNDKGLDTWLICIPAIPKLRWLNNIIRTVIGFMIYTKKVKKNFEPDIMHVHSFLAGEIAWKIYRKFCIPYAITEHSSSFARDYLCSSYNKIAWRVFTNAKIRFAVSKQLQILLEKNYNCTFSYIPNVIPIDEINQVESVKKKDVSIIRICNVANLNKNKRHDRLIKAFHSVLSKFNNLELQIAGDGPERLNLKTLVKELNIEDKVFFHGSISRNEVFKLMKSCDIFALTSDYETFGVVLIEAMACGLPVISTKCGGPESIIKSKQVGMLVDKDDLSVKLGLEQIIKNRNNYVRNTIKSYVMSKFSFKAVGLNLSEKMRMVLENERK